MSPTAPSITCPPPHRHTCTPDTHNSDAKPHTPPKAFCRHTPTAPRETHGHRPTHTPFRLFPQKHSPRVSPHIHQHTLPLHIPRHPQTQTHPTRPLRSPPRPHLDTHNPHNAAPRASSATHHVRRRPWTELSLQAHSPASSGLLVEILDELRLLGSNTHSLMDPLASF